jgi:lipoprotein-anchoring transpeptidase ErfK/SrfK
MSFFSFLRARPVALACGVFYCCQFAGGVAALAETSSAEPTADPIATLPAPPAASTPQDQASTLRETAPAEAPAFPQPNNPPAPDASTPSAAPAPPVAAPAYGESLRSIVDRRHLALPLEEARIVIDKSQRRLDLLSGSTLVKSYRIALGKNPVGAKRSEGDSRTPEGRFYICTRNAKTSAFHIFLGLSYPALPDAKRAVNNQQITWREYQIIHQRLASRGRPPWETNLGGWVGIHGGSDDTFAQRKMKERDSRDWTAGCIALTNREIEEIYAATKLGTPVEIRP